VTAAEAHPDSYRPDIDGLRAVAVLMVILWHAGAPGFQSGYAGVDVFFVISGYVITGTLNRDAAAGRFSVLGFYERRVRRIAPALLVMLLAVLAAALVIEFPSDLRRTASLALAVVGLVANYVLLGQSGYFAPDAAVQPLRHTWSLSIEEQFYLVYPLLFAVLGVRRRRTFVLLLGALLLVSFGLHQLTPSYRFGATYLASPYRAWELLLGCVLSLEGGRWRPSRWICELLTIAAALIIAVAADRPLLAQNGLTSALRLGAAGAALMIFANTGDTLARRALAWRPLVLVGLASYSLYLWHWPLFAFAASLEPAGTPLAVKLVLLAASAALGFASWRFVERPFRTPPASAAARWRRLWILFAGAAAVCLLAAIIELSDGAPARFPPAVVRLDAYGDYVYGPAWARQFRVPCFDARTDGFPAYAPAPCLAVAPGRKSVLLWGSSHAGHLAEPLGELTARLGASFTQATQAGCSPSLYNPTASRECRRFNAAVGAHLAAHRPDVVILSSKDPRPLPGLAQTIRQLTNAGTVVILVGESPEFKVELPALLARAWPDATAAPNAQLVPEPFRTDAAMKAQFAAMPGVEYVSLMDALCPRGRCVAVVGDGAPLTSDKDHFSLAGARYAVDLALAAPLAKALSGPAKPRSPVAYVRSP
jgi:peptidoglycan/LPS O-acetylase OafA/YrhL